MFVTRCLKRNFKTFIMFLYWILNIFVLISEFINEIFKDVLNQLSLDTSWDILCRMLLNWFAFLKIQSAWWVFWNVLRAYQDWLELVNDLVEIWFRSDSDLTQIWLNTLLLSQHSFLSSTSCSSTSSSFHVTNTFLSSLAQSLNIT